MTKNDLKELVSLQIDIEKRIELTARRTTPKSRKDLWDKEVEKIRKERG